MSDYLLVITVIYDGDCDFCRSCVAWIQNRIKIKALANQSIKPEDFGVTREQCERSVVVIDEKIYLRSRAVAHLLANSGNKWAARFLQALGPISELGYRYVASHRNGKLVAFLHLMIIRTI